jgi:Tfp pilus assembly protein PilZ
MAVEADRGNGNPRVSDVDKPESRSYPVRSPAERRAVPRWVVDLPVTVNGERTSYEGLLRDMGTAGVFVVTHRAHAIGEWIELWIRLPDGGPPVRAIGEVRWTRAYRGEDGPEPGMGVEFRAVSPQDGARITVHLSRGEPLEQAS